MKLICVEDAKAALVTVSIYAIVVRRREKKVWRGAFRLLVLVTSNESIEEVTNPSKMLIQALCDKRALALRHPAVPMKGLVVREVKQCRV